MGDWKGQQWGGGGGPDDGDAVLVGGQSGPLVFGTTDARPVSLITAGVPRIRVDADGTINFLGTVVGIGETLTGSTPGNASSESVELLVNGSGYLTLPNSKGATINVYVDADGTLTADGTVVGRSFQQLVKFRCNFAGTISRVATGVQEQIGDAALADMTITVDAAGSPDRIRITATTGAAAAALNLTARAEVEQSTTAYATLQISPLSPSMSPDDQQQFIAVGGIGSRSWNITVNNSGGTIDGSGLYTAGPSGGLDTVEVQDAMSHVADTNATVVAGAECLRFDGSQNYVEVPASPDFGGLALFTFELWMKPNVTPSGYNTIMAGNTVDPAAGGFYWLYHDGGNLYPVANIGGVAVFPGGGQGGNLHDGSWHHVAFTYDGANLNTWVDGAFVAALGASGNLGASVDDLLIGWNDGGSGGSVFPGMLALVRFSDNVRYSVPFTPSRAYGSDVDTIAFWPLDDGSGTTPADTSGNGHGGSFQGSPPPQWVAGF